VLVVENLSINYGGVRALSGIDLKVDQGQIGTLIGANGAGKSTTVRAISGQIKGLGGTITSGRITFEDQTITTMAVHRIARLGVVQVPEGRRVFPNLSVKENLFMGGYNRSRDPGFAADIEHIAVVGHTERSHGILLNQKDGGPGPVDILDDVKDLIHHVGGQTQGRLVHHNQLGSGHHGPTNGQHLTLAPGEGPAQLVIALLQARKQGENVLYIRRKTGVTGTVVTAHE